MLKNRPLVPSFVFRVGDFKAAEWFAFMVMLAASFTIAGACAAWLLSLIP